ncbi:MAG: CapA family protein [Acidimicrobiales bacterium]
MTDGDPDNTGPQGSASNRPSSQRPPSSSYQPRHAREVAASEPRWWRRGLAALGVLALLAVTVIAYQVSDRRSEDRVSSGPAATTSTLVDRSTSSRSTTSRSTTTLSGPDGDPGSVTTTTRGSKKPKPKPMTGPDAITLAFAGDLLPHTPLTAQAARYGSTTAKRFDFDPMLAPMKPIISGADVAICHMETPVAPDQNRLSGYPAFGGPVELVDAAKNAGYDGCSNGSNHSLDRGQEGIAATLARFDQDGLHHAGTARSAQEAATTTVYDVKGVKVAHLSYAYGFNGYRLPANAPWAANQIDVGRIKVAAAKARAEGADLVVLSVHWGNEYQSDPSRDQRDVAMALLPSPDIDLIIGCHAHVVQPIDQVGGTFVVWGMGNQLANQQEVPKVDGLTAIATARRGPDGKWKVAGVEAVPTWVEGGTFRVLPAVPTLADPAIPTGLRAALSASYDRTAATVLRNHTPGVSVAPKPG